MQVKTTKRNNGITYQVRPQGSLFFIDQIADGELDKSFGPFWSRDAAQALIQRWETESQEIVLLPEIKGWERV